MNVTLDEAIGIYARASRAWFGPGAAQKTQDRIEELRKAGDIEGVRVWQKVKSTIEQLDEAELQSACLEDA